MRFLQGMFLFATTVSIAPAVFGVEGNFQASILVYGSPTSVPAVAYNVPAGANLSFYTSREVADDVTLGGTDRVIAAVKFEYYANYALTAGLTFRMYERASEGVPGILIYSVPLEILSGGGLVDVSFSYDLANALPDRFFFSVQFSGQAPGQVAGMIIPDRPATTGTSADQLWEKRGNNWKELDLNATHGRQLGLRQEGRALKFKVADAPRTMVTVESTSGLGGEWIPVGQVETDDNGDAEFEGETGEGDQVFFRTVGP